MKAPPSGLEEVLGHAFRDAGLLARAVTHRGALRVGDHGYERLEFLGDRVLGMAVAAMLYRHFPAESEGQLSQRQAELVRKETLAAIARGLAIGGHLHLAAGEENLRDSEAVLADVLEALVAALYLDGGSGPAFAFVERHWHPHMIAHRRPPRDAKTRLQEWALARGLPLPCYRLLARCGPDHAPTITVAASVEGLARQEASGPSRRAAEQEAARRLLERAGAP